MAISLGGTQTKFEAKAKDFSRKIDNFYNSGKMAESFTLILILVS